MFNRLPENCFEYQMLYHNIHSDISLQLSVIPGLTRNPAFFWIPAFAGMTYSYLINDAVYKSIVLTPDNI